MKPGDTGTAAFGFYAAARFLSAYMDADQNTPVSIAIGVEIGDVDPTPLLVLSVDGVTAALPVGSMTDAFLAAVRALAAQEPRSGAFRRLAENVAASLADPAARLPGGAVH